MSPTLEKKPLDVSGVSHKPSLAMGTDPIADLLDNAGWKAQRKLKHQRDLQKRGSAAAPRAKHGAPSHSHAESRGRSIPNRRKEKVASSSPLLLSRSMPSARSWPPEKDASDLMQEASEENLDPNWILDNRTPLASSAPESSFMNRNYGSKREARTMTLFDCAMIFNESGSLLSHEDFHEMGSSPEFGSHGRRKQHKRRVGRHKPEKKKVAEPHDSMTPDDVVLEMMHVFLPDIEVTKELNMLFLGGSRHHGDVFDFEHDATTDNQASHSVGKSQSCKLLRIDVLKFQASLKKLLFAKGEPEYEMPSAGTPAVEIVDSFITEQWISNCILRVIKLDVLAQYDAYAVLLAMYRTMPSLRNPILKSLVDGCLAIFDHQAMDHLLPTSGERKLVSMKGSIAMLNALLILTEQELVESPDIYGENPSEIDDALNDICNRIVEALKLLVRSSPGGKRTKDDNNQVEKFQEGSDSVEATTYSAIGEVINRLSVFSPMHGQELLAWMLRKWPQRNVQLQLFYVRFIMGILVQFMITGVFLPSELVSKAFSRLRACIKSPHFLVAKEASSVCGNLPLMDMYLTHDQELREKVAAALHENATSHWNDRIRQMSDECFDMLLDLA